MADAKVPLLASHSQFPLTPNSVADQNAQESSPVASGCCLHVAIIQQSVRRWQRPWRHQRVIVLFAASARDMRLRLQLEGRVRVGEHVLRVIRAGA